MTLWFHPMCAAYKREPMLGGACRIDGDVADRAKLELAAKGSMAHRRLERIDGAERGRRGRQRATALPRADPKGDWRIRLTFFDEGQFESGGGFIHLACIKTLLRPATSSSGCCFSRALRGRSRRLGKAIAASL